MENTWTNTVKKSRNLHSLQEQHAFCPSDGIRFTPSLPCANAGIIATSMSSFLVAEGWNLQKTVLFHAQDTEKLG